MNIDFNRIGSTVCEFFSNGWQNLTNGFDKICQSIGNFFSSLSNKITSNVESRGLNEFKVSIPTSNPFKKNDDSMGVETFEGNSTNCKSPHFDLDAAMICNKLDNESLKNALSNLKENGYDNDSFAFLDMRMVFEEALKNALGKESVSKDDIMEFLPRTLKQLGIEDSEIDNVKSSYLQRLASEE